MPSIIYFGSWPVTLKLGTAPTITTGFKRWKFRANKDLQRQKWGGNIRQVLPGNGLDTFTWTRCGIHDRTSGELRALFTRITQLRSMQWARRNPSALSRQRSAVIWRASKAHNNEMWMAKATLRFHSWMLSLLQPSISLTDPWV